MPSLGLVQLLDNHRLEEALQLGLEHGEHLTGALCTFSKKEKNYELIIKKDEPSDENAR